MNRHQLALLLAVRRAHADDDPTPAFSLTAPVLTLLTAANVKQPIFGIDPVGELENDVFRLEWDNAIPYAAEQSHADYTLTALDVGGDFELDFGLTAFPDGAHSFRLVHMRTGWTSATSNEAPVTFDVTAPTITSGTTAYNAENSVLAHTLTANESVTWTITGGADSSRFEISGSTLRWLSNGTKDYEIPNDADTNNTYVVQVTATDAAAIQAHNPASANPITPLKKSSTATAPVQSAKSVPICNFTF